MTLFTQEETTLDKLSELWVEREQLPLSHDSTIASLMRETDIEYAQRLHLLISIAKEALQS